MKRTACALVATVLVACGDPAAPVCPQPEVLEGTLSGETTVGAECLNWVARGMVNVPADAKLVILPGVTLTFESGAGLLVRGKLVAVGDEEHPIRLTGAEQQPGFWQGLVFHSASSTENRLSHVTLEFAGGAKYSWAEEAAGLTLVGEPATPSRVTVEHSTIRKSEAFGVVVDAHSKLPGFSSNTLTGNATGAGHAFPASVGEFVTGNAYTGNTQDRIQVARGPLESEVVVSAVGVPFHAGGFDVAAGGKLTLQPGTTVAFASGARLRLAGGGKLVAAGTAEAPIVLTGLEAVPGFWQGVIVHDSGSTENVLSHAVVEYAGGAQDSWASAAANVALTIDAATLAVSNTVLRHGAGYGLYIDADATVSGFEGNTLTSNALGAAYVFARSANHLLGTSHYTGNASGRDYVSVREVPINDARTWSALDVPYRVQRFKVETGGHLTVSPGAILQFEADGFLEVSSGRLTAVGTASAPITFTRDPGVAGWSGVRFFGSSATGNRLEHVEVSNAGSTQWSWATERAGLAVANSSSVHVASSRFVNNQGRPIWIEADSTVTGCASATFEGNTNNTPSRACD